MSDNKRQDLPFFGIPKIWPYVRKFSKPIIWSVIFNLISCGINVLQPVMQRYALNHFVEENTLDTMLPFILVFLAGLTVMALANRANCILCQSTEVSINQDLRNRAFEHLQTLSFDYYNQNNVGYIQARVMSDAARVGDLFTWHINDMAYFIIYVFVAIGIMLSINPRLTGWILLIVPIVAVVFSLFNKKLIDLNHQVRELNSKITGDFNEGIVGAKTIKSLVIEKRIFRDFETDTSAIKEKAVETARYRGAFGAITNFASSMGLAIVLWKGGLLDPEDIGTFSLFMSYAQGIMEPIRFFIDVIAMFVVGQVNIERFTRLMDTQPTVKDTKAVEDVYGTSFEPKKENWEPIVGDIEFRNVDFMYPDGDEYVLENFNLKIPFGTNIAIVGETGAGKSTLANLICRFFEPTRGQVLIDGKDSRERSQLWLHSALGYVLQTPHLFSGTIRENLTYGNEDATEEQIMEAVRLVSADAVISRLENGLDTNVGEGGDMLSAGEKQLISFARTILADPRIIVLDEATASVDTITEQQIQAAIDKVIAGRTSIVIAHRLSTVKNADLILVVNGGKIVEQGKHEELLEKKGYYYRLWTRQFEDEAAGAVLDAR